MTLTRMLREELAHIAIPDRASRIEQAAGMVRFGGRWHNRTQGPEVVVRCAYGAVARRLRQCLVDDLGSRPDISRHMGTNLAHSGGWLVSVGLDELTGLGLCPVNRQGGSWPPPPNEPPGQHIDILVSGAIMVAGSLSAPHAPVHFELNAPNHETAQWVSGKMHWPSPIDGRIVIKNSTLVEGLLKKIGGENTLMTFQSGRQLLALRKTANRTANADRANLARTTAAAAKQIEAIEKIVEFEGWGAFPDTLRPLALARVASPEASLAELGALMIPPVDKATIHRRLKRILDLAVPLDGENN
ncbi:DNA-binding protein WhiA [Stomatohabitans albus]|uniref:DNA-binding protein WhiA n=1 Tax=Stomatohabitans albus TaxID=3110766 RepID=UPI00300D3567